MLERYFPNVVANIRAAIIQTVAIVIAALIGIVAIGFFTGALYMWLAWELGPVWSALIVGGLYLLVALIIFAVGKSRAQRQKPKVVVQRTAEPQGMMANVAEGLARTGFRREGLALRAAAEASKSLRPSHYAALSLLVGFVLGRRFYSSKS